MNPRNSSGRNRSTGRGWYGDEEGHSEAAMEGWQHRRGGRSRRSEDDDDDYQRSSRSGRSTSSRSGDGRGWYGDEEEHSRAARKGWRSRD